MANITIRINTDNAAFADGNEQAEVARILRDTANRIQTRGFDYVTKVMDENGNSVGTVDYQED